MAGDIGIGATVRYDVKDWYPEWWFEGEVVGPASNGYEGWWSVLVTASSLPSTIGARQDFAGYSLRRITAGVNHGR